MFNGVNSSKCSGVTLQNKESGTVVCLAARVCRNSSLITYLTFWNINMVRYTGTNQELVRPFRYCVKTQP